MLNNWKPEELKKKVFKMLYVNKKNIKNTETTYCLQNLINNFSKNFRVISGTCSKTKYLDWIKFRKIKECVILFVNPDYSYILYF